MTKKPRRRPVERAARGGRKPDPEAVQRDWSIPTKDWPLLDEARLGYWRAVLSGNQKRIASALKAWSDLLRVPLTRKT
jgi:hypothetical protein